MSVRLENYLFRCDVGTYKEISEIIADNRVKVNGALQNDNNYKVDAASDFVDVDDKLLSYRKYVYVMVNKPSGYSGNGTDAEDKTVFDILPSWCARRKTQPVNILDKEMSGLVLVTDDIGYAHHFHSRKRNSVYHVQTNRPVTIEHVEAFASGMRLKHYVGESATLLKADSYFRDEFGARVCAKESSYNDLKKMFRALKISVLSIELIAIDDLVLPIELDEGQWRELNSEELSMMRIKNPYF